MGLVQTLGALVRRPPPTPAAPNAAAVLARVEPLVEQGRRLEAIDLIEAHAQRLDDLALWSQLGVLRLEAVPEAAARQTPLPTWPLDLPDPFPGGQGLPEVAAADLTWPILGGAILHHGSLIVRGLFDEPTCAILRAGIDGALDGYDTFQKTGEPTSNYLPIALPEGAKLAHGRGWSRDSGGVWAVESPRLFQQVLGLFEDRGVIDVVGGYLGERPLLSVGKSVLRRAEPDANGVFHQDGAFMGRDIRTVNVWTALSDCGEDAPGLEIVARRLSDVVETGTDGAIFHWAAGRPAAERAAGEAPIVAPVFAAGDALMFDQLMLHSTYGRPEMTQRRYAVESWFFAPSAYAPDQSPLVI